MNSWTYWTDEQFPESIRKDMKWVIDVVFGTPCDHDVSHSADSYKYSLYSYSSGGYAIKMTHGGGTRWLTTIHGSTTALFIRNNIGRFDAFQLWELFHMMFDLYEDGMGNSSRIVSDMYTKAFAEGRLKKRKVREHSEYKIWIEQ